MDLDSATKEEIQDLVVMNSQLHCRRSANPGYTMLDGDEVSYVELDRVSSGAELGEKV